ncbi:HAD-IIB family hydrolase [Sessilibacter corallicola]|uniref:Mannosyl-3-phosphoglycerate phosphatase-related protein n=1 Tax=Sessilibacter corallicola TaxID=2904075 RepID=A0ABQ0A7W1_9GAMM|nr:HAD-IIB family hydrolase [Sessilibacter corallicola]MCE2028905.1 HAD-IIB family hydrolase [Sessilibacter corallicola]
MEVMIFTDMDGTLLDHYSYSHKPVDELLVDLRKLTIPVIPITSKTFSELIPLRLEIKSACPFVIENGAAVVLPKAAFPLASMISKGDDIEDAGDYWIKSFCPNRHYWQSLIFSIKDEFPCQFSTFSELGVEGVAEVTGLSLGQAELAVDRQYGEPVYWTGNAKDLEKFCSRITELGGFTLRGGRFTHVSGNVDKGKALLWLKKLYEKKNGKQIKSIALGDSGNDIAMLQAANFPVIIRSPVHEPPLFQQTENNRVPAMITSATGPEGWDVAVKELLKMIGVMTSPKEVNNDG